MLPTKLFAGAMHVCAAVQMQYVYSKVGQHQMTQSTNQSNPPVQRYGADQGISGQTFTFSLPAHMHVYTHTHMHNEDFGG